MPNDDQLWHYCLQHSTQTAPVLQELERETHLRTIYPQMLSGPIQGLFLQLISQMIRPSRILEIGTFTGYGTICLAQGLSENGIIHTIEGNDEFIPIINKYVQLAKLEQKVIIHLGDAAEILPTLGELFDLVFLDAGKMDYLLHYELALPKIRAGGFLLADNVLWAGKVLLDRQDATAQTLHTFNCMVNADDRVENLILPLRDGLMLVRKK